MHISSKLIRRAVAPVFAAVTASVAQAVVINFDSGYTTGGVVTGVDDANVTGSAAWATKFAGGTSATVADLSIAAPGVAGMSGGAYYVGSAAGSGAAGNSIDLSSAIGASGVDFTKEVQFKFTVLIASASGSGNLLTIALGDANITNQLGNTWFTLAISGTTPSVHATYLTRNTGSNAQAPLNVSGGNSEYRDFGGTATTPVTYDIRFNPVTKLYTGVYVNGVDYTSVAGGTNFGASALPLTGASAAYVLSVFKSSSQTADVYIDNITLQNVGAVPEPSSFAALAGLGAFGFCMTRRRSRA